MRKFLILIGAMVMLTSVIFAQSHPTKIGAMDSRTVQIDEKKSETVETERVRPHQVGEMTLQQKQEKYMQLSPELRSVMRKPDFLKTDAEKQRKGSTTLRTYRGETAFAHNFFEEVWVSFDVDNINGQAFFAPWGLIEQPFSGAQVGDFIYVYGTYAPWGIEHTTWFVLDRETGAIISQVQKSQFYGKICSGLTFDYTTETMYLVSESELFTVDLATGDATSIGMMSGQSNTVISIACDLDGNMYALAFGASDSSPSNFYSVNKSTGVLTLIGSTGVDAWYAQTMGFDLIDGTLYWLHYSAYTGGSFRTINVATGASTLIEGTGYAEDEYSSFFIPYVADPSAPAAVTGFTVTPGAAGALTADLAWTNPTLTVIGDPLTTITEVNVYENNSVIYTQTNPAPGSAGSYSQTTATAGFKTYKVTPENAFGEGISVTQTHWIGHDVPAAPTALQGEEDEFAPGEVNLSWTAPTTGLNGAYFTATGLTYTIVRNPGNNTLATGYTSTTYNDDEGLSDGVYTYIVTAVNNSGEGGSASVSVIVGDMCPIRLVSTGTLGDSWNGGANFTLEVDGIFYGQFGIIYPGESLIYKEEFGLIPPGELKIYWNGGFYGGECGIEVYDIMDDLIYSVSGLPSGVTNQLLFTHTWFCTPPDYELRATAVLGPNITTLGTPTTYTTDVFSKGGVALTGSEYSVKFYEEGILLTTLPGVAIDYEETKTFTYVWTPATPGTRILTAEIDFSLDEFPGNNATGNKNVYVYDGVANFVDICVGDGTTLEQFPIRHFYRKSLAQFMYHPQDLEVYGGSIWGITLQSSIASANIAPNQIKIWAAETTQNDLSSYIPFSEFVEVMDKVISFPAGDNDVEMEFDQPFEYNGGNLVLYIYYYDSPYYSSSDRYYITSADGVRSRMNYTDGTSGVEMDFANPGSAGTLVYGNYYPNICFIWDVAGLGTLTGVVDNDSGVLLEGATISITDGGAPKFATTDEDGVYLYPGLPDGTYTLTAKAHGHYDSAPITVTIVEDVTTTEDVTLIELPKVVVSGTVTGSDGSGPIEGVVIKLSGYEPYQATTNSAGFYTISDVYADQTYAFEATAMGWVKYTDDLVVGNTNVTHNFQMDEIPFPVPFVDVTDIDGSNVLVEWDVPSQGENVTYILDDDSFEYSMGINPGYNISVGNIFAVGESGQVTGISAYFQLRSSGPAVKTLIADIYDEDRNLVGSSEPFLTTGDAWNDVLLPDLPYSGTFYAMLRWIGSVEGYSNWFGVDQNGPYASTNPAWTINDGTWEPSTSSGWFSVPSVWMIRVEAFSMGKKIIYTYEGGDEKEGDRSLTNYQVYRLPHDQQGDETAWTTLTANTTNLDYTDNTWGSAPTGWYRWAVKAEYTANESLPRFSKPLPTPDISFPFTINITTNDAQDPTGAYVQLTGLDMTPAGEYLYFDGYSDATGITFQGVVEGDYKLEIELEPYVAINKTITITGTGSISEMLTEKITPPGTVTATKNQDETIVHIEWEAEPGFVAFTYEIDDDSDENGLRINASAEAYLGNHYVEAADDAGFITSVDIWGMGSSGGLTRAVTLDIFDADQVLIAQSEEFIIPHEEWVNVPLPNIPFEGIFYAMIHWYPTPTETYYVGMDENGPFSHGQHSWYLSGGTWSTIQSIGYPCAFMIRVNANVLFSKSVTYGSEFTYSENIGNRTATPIFVDNISFEKRTVPSNAGELYVAPIQKESTDLSRVKLHYNVYRLEAGEETFPALWEDVSLGVTELECYDNDFGPLGPGVYKYAVTSVYTGDVESVPSFSKDVPKDMETPFCVVITTNSGDPVNGAQVVLTQEDGPNVYNATANGPEVCWDFIWKGIYTINITLDGFLPYEVNGEGIWNDNPHNAELIEIIVEPVRLEVEVEDCNALFTWNNAPDLVNVTLAANDVWGDGTGYILLLDETATEFGNTIPLTGPISGCPAPPTLFVPFSHKIPEIAEPSCSPPAGHWVVIGSETIGIPPGIYDWCLVNPDPSWPNMWIAGGSGATDGRRDDYEFEIGKSYHFQMLGTPSGDWVEITITDDAKLMPKTRAFVGYRVYLNGEYYGQTTNEAWDFVNLNGGTYVAGVQAVYTSGVSDIIESDPFTIAGTCIFNTITFEVTDAETEDEILDATIVFDGVTLPGYIVGVDSAGPFDYTVSKAGYNSVSGTTGTVTGDMTIEVALEPITVIVTFNVTFQGAAVTDATITWDGATVGYVIENVRPGSYPWTVTHPEYQPASGTQLIGEQDVTINVPLEEPPGIRGTGLSNVVLYPNPFNNEISVSNPELVKRIQITNAVGQLASDVVFNGRAIETSNLNSGVYFVTIESHNGDKVVHKMIKK